MRCYHHGISDININFTLISIICVNIKTDLSHYLSMNGPNQIKSIIASYLR